MGWFGDAIPVSEFSQRSATWRGTSTDLRQITQCMASQEQLGSAGGPPPGGDPLAAASPAFSSPKYSQKSLGDMAAAGQGGGDSCEPHGSDLESEDQQQQAKAAYLARLSRKSVAMIEEVSRVPKPAAAGDGRRPPSMRAAPGPQAWDAQLQFTVRSAGPSRNPSATASREDRAGQAGPAA